MVRLKFYSEHEADQFVFYRIPKILFTDKRYLKISTEAKLLYGLLLDRMSLSRKNGWIDDEGHVYIYFTLKEAIEIMGIGKEKGVKLFAELDEEKGCGLILRKRQGQGKPTLIYVLNANSYYESCDSMDLVDEGEEDKCKTSEKQTSELPDGNEFLTSEKWKSALLKKQRYRLPGNRSVDIQKTDSNNNKNNNIEFNKINHILSCQNSCELEKKNEIDERINYRNLILKNIEYQCLIESDYSKEEVGGLVDIMLDLACSKKEYVIVNSAEIPQTAVKSRMLKIGYEHIKYVLECVKNNSTKIRNIKSYLITSLYNAPTTIECFYTAEVNHDLNRA